MRCVYCQQAFGANLSLKEVFLGQELWPKVLCGPCQKRFVRNQGTTCSGCDKGGVVGFCSDCQAWRRLYPERVLCHKSLYRYDEALHDWFQQYKFRGNLRLASAFSQELQAFFRTYQKWQIIPIPLSEKGIETRGFNQVEAFLEAAGISYRPLLKKGQEVEPQSTKSRMDRLHTPQSFFLPARAYPGIKGKRVLIVDDVYTTGRTLMHARDALDLAEPLEVRTFSLAR